MTTMTVKGAWKGWDGKTFVEMTDGSKWKQAEYHYAYRPEATVTNDGGAAFRKPLVSRRFGQIDPRRQARVTSDAT